MAKITMHQELDELRKEVEALKKEKKEREEQAQIETLKAEKEQLNNIEQAEAKVSNIIESLESGKADAKETLNHLLDTIKNDYKNISPISAIALFALGAAFGNVISSK